VSILDDGILGYWIHKLRNKFQHSVFIMQKATYITSGRNLLTKTFFLNYDILLRIQQKYII